MTTGTACGSSPSVRNSRKFLARRNSGVPIATLPRRSRTMMSRTSESTCRRSASSIFMRRRSRPGSVVEDRAGGLAPRRLHHPRPRGQHRPLEEDVDRPRREPSARPATPSASNRSPGTAGDGSHTNVTRILSSLPSDSPNHGRISGLLRRAGSSGTGDPGPVGIRQQLRAQPIVGRWRPVAASRARTCTPARVTRTCTGWNAPSSSCVAAIRQHVVGGRVGGRGADGGGQVRRRLHLRARWPPSGRRCRARATGARHRQSDRGAPSRTG